MAWPCLFCCPAAASPWNTEKVAPHVFLVPALADCIQYGMATRLDECRYRFSIVLIAYWEVVVLPLLDEFLVILLAQILYLLELGVRARFVNLHLVEVTVPHHVLQESIHGTYMPTCLILGSRGRS